MKSSPVLYKGRDQGSAGVTRGDLTDEWLNMAFASVPGTPCSKEAQGSADAFLQAENLELLRELAEVKIQSSKCAFNLLMTDLIPNLTGVHHGF